MAETYIPGKFYTVPTVSALWYEYPRRDWVIHGSWHSDAEFFNFPDYHYHLHPQFVPHRIYRENRRAVFSMVLFHKRNDDLGWDVADPLNCRVGEVVMRRVQCLRRMPRHPFRESRIPRAIRQLTDAYAEHRINPRRPVCPHRGYDLSRVPVRDGCIECPLHGLRFDSKTGKTKQFPENAGAPA